MNAAIANCSFIINIYIVGSKDLTNIISGLNKNAAENIINFASLVTDSQSYCFFHYEILMFLSSQGVFVKPCSFVVGH